MSHTPLARWTARSDRFWDLLLNGGTARPAGPDLPARRTRLAVEALEDRVVPTGRPLPLPFVFAGAGSGAPPTVKAYHAETGLLAFERTPFSPDFTGGVRVAAGDIDRDGLPDLVCAAGPGGGPRVVVYSGKDGSVLRDFFAYDPAFTGGVSVAAGDVNGDGVADVVTAAGAGGGPHVKAFSGKDGSLLANFFAFAPDFRGGATVAAADFTGDGKADLVVGAGPGGGPHVRVFDVGTGKPVPGPAGNFFAFAPDFRGGVEVGTDALAGDVTGDGKPDVVVGRGAGAGSLVRVFDGVTAKVALEFSPFGAGMTAGVRVATAFVDDDKYADVIVGTGAGPASTVKVFGGTTGAELAAPMSPYAPFGAGHTGGVYVAASNDPPAPSYANVSSPDFTIAAGGCYTFLIQMHEIDSAGTHVPSGTVTLTLGLGGRILGSAALTPGPTAGFSNATVHVPPNTFAVGKYSTYTPPPIIWQYGGDSYFATSQGYAPPLTVTPPVLPDRPECPACSAGSDVRGAAGAGNNGGTGKLSGVDDRGTVRVALADVGGDGFGAPMGGRITWSNASGYADGFAGGGTRLDDLSRLVDSGAGTGTLAVITSANTSVNFTRNGPVYAAQFGSPTALAYAPGPDEYTATGGDGSTQVFYGFGGAVPGGLKVRTDAGGNATTVSWDLAAGRPLAIEKADALTGAAERIDYAYGGGGLIAAMTRSRRVGGGPYAPVRTTTLTYAVPAGASTSALVGTVETDGSGAFLGETYDQYYAAGSAAGYGGALQFHLGEAAAALLRQAYPGVGFDHLGVYVPGFADNGFEYTDCGRVSKAVTAGAGPSAGGGGLGTSTFDYVAGPGGSGGPNEWAAKTSETRGDGTTAWAYSNAHGQTMLAGVRGPGGGDWLAFTRFNADGQIAFTAAPSAVTGYDGTSADLVGYGGGGDAAYLSNAAGLVTAYAYGGGTTATAAVPGDVAGYVSGVSVRRGEFGAAVKLADSAYVARTAGGATTYHVAGSTDYRNADGTGGAASATAYTWLGATHQAASATTTAAAVAAGQNGPGAATAATTVYDAFGRPTWGRDAAGVLSYTAYDPGTGAVAETIADVDVANTADFAGLPAGWTTPGGAGRHRVTAAEVDALGRPTKVTGPLGRVAYAVYDDPGHAARVYPGWDVVAGTPTGPTVVVRDDRANGYAEALTMAAVPAVSGGRPTGTEAVSAVRSLRRTYRNAGGQDVATDAYFDLTGVAYSTAPGLGAPGVNYARTQTGYDGTGEANRTVGAAGTVTRTERDALGRLVSTWVGTNDTPTAGPWSPANLAGTDMAKAAEVEYDGGLVGDSNATAVTRFPGGAAAPRATRAWYDWRDRPVAVKSGAEASESPTVHRPIAYLDYDNLDRVVATRVYDGDGVTPTATNGVPDAPAAGLLRARSTTAYDDLGRAYLAQTFGVDQTTGAVGANPLTTAVWYDAVGSVLEVASPGGLVRKYQYDGLGRPTASYATDGGGGAGYAAAGTVAGDVVLSQSETAYDAAGNPVLSTTRGRFDGETATGPLGTPTTGPRARVTYAAAYYDAAGRLTDAVDVGTNGGAVYARPAAAPARSDAVHVATNAYDPAGRLAAVTDAAGATSTATYNLAGQPLAVTAAAGTAVALTWQYAYDAAGRQLTVAAPGARTTRWGYDGLGRPTAVTERDGTALARTSTTAYNLLGEAQSMADSLGTVTAVARDVLGRTVGVTAAAGTALARSSSAAYDALGRVVASTDPRGFVTATAYDDIARTEAITTPDLATTTVAHDPAGRVVGVTDPLGFASRAQYDLLGRATSAADPLGNATKYRYAVNGAADLETDPLNRVTARYADAFGRTASVADALARTTAFTYDRADRTATVTDPRGTVGATTYDALGRTSKVTEAAGTALERSTSWAYTAAGDLASVTDPRGFVTAFGYDSGGRRTSVTGASGQPEALTVTTGYDLLDRPTGVTRPGGRTTGYAYDALGQLVRVDEAVGTSLARATTLAYDAAGHRTSATEPMGRVSSTAYDAMGRPATATDPRAGVTKYAYDLAGRLKSLTDPNSNVTAWGYDAAGRRTSATDPLGKSTAYAYDAAGQLVGVTDRTGRRKALSYDAAGQLVGEDWFDAANAKLDARAFAYDAGGNLTSAANNAGTYALAYDALNRVTTVAEPFGATLAFGYDAGGNRTSVTDGFGGVTASAYDGLGRLTGRHLSGTGVTPAKVAWGYDAAGDATTLTRSAKAGAAWAVAAATAMAFDALGRTVSIATTAGGGAAVSASAYAYDAGDRLASETVNGVTRSYGYDVGDQVTSDGGAAVTYDAAGNRTSGGTTVTAGNRLSSDGAWAYAYDAEGRVASKSAGAVTWAYGYDLNGQLTSAASGGTSVAYAYDAFGNRVQRSETAGGATATELFAYDGWDTARPGAVGGENFDAWADLSGTTNALTTRRVSGGGFDAPLFKETAAGVAGWYDVDHLGSVRKVFDNTGTVTGSRDYAAFGAATAASGTGLDRYGYTAREWDAALSLQYSRARMYDPGTGRWTGEDPAGFAAGDADLHRYVGNDSTGRTDPSGLVDVPSHWHHRIPKALFGGEHGELLKSLLSGAFVHGPGNGWYLTDGMHSEIHGNYNGATGGDTYTKKWEQFLDKYPNATREQIFAFRDRIEIEFGYRTVDPKTGKVVPVPGRGQPVTSVDGMPYTEGGSASADPAKDSRMCQSERDKFRKSNKVKGYQPSVADLATDAAIKRSQQAKAAIQKLNDAIAKLAKGVKSNTTYLINNGNKGAATKGLAAVGTVLAISGPIDAAINFDSDAVMKDLIKLAQLHDKYENESQPSEKDVIYVTEFLAHLRSMLINHFGFDDASAGMAYYFWNLSYMGNYVK